MKKLLISALSILLLITSVLGLSACNTVKKYEITFVVNEKVYSKVETAGNEEIEFPATPAISGYIFKGWFVDKDSWTEELTPDTLKNRPLEEDLTVYAWLEKSETSGGNSTSGEGTHTHTYNKQDTSKKYQKSNATCKAKAVYYYSCECGEMGTATFEYGEIGDHDYVDGKCSVCQKDEPTSPPSHTHTYNKQDPSKKHLKSSATCKAKALYYYSCECGETGTATFEYGEIGNHDYVDGKCSVCRADDPSIIPAPTGPYCVDKATWTKLLSYCTNGKVKVAPGTLPEYTVYSLDGNKVKEEQYENGNLTSTLYAEEDNGTYYTYQVVGSDWQKFPGDAGSFLECSMFVNMGAQFKDSFDSFTYDEDEKCYLATNLQAQGSSFDSVKIYFENGAYKGLECSSGMFMKIYDVGSTTITLPTVK